MADDINKKITIDVEINTDGQQQINQYKAAFDSLRASVANLSNPLATLSNSISSFDKDVAKLTTSIDKLNKQNLELTSAGSKTKTMVKELMESFVSWKEILDRGKEAVKSFNIALTGGLAIVTTFLPYMVDLISGWLKGDAALTTLNQALSDNQKATEAVNQATAQGTDSAQQELVHLKLLYEATRDSVVGLEARKKIIAELQSQYPGYFDNLSAEAFLNGKAAKGYSDLTKAIIAASQAKAAEEMITKNQLRQLGNDNSLGKLNADLLQYNQQLKAAKKEYDDYMKNPIVGGGGLALTDVVQSTLSDNYEHFQDMIDQTRQSISHLKTDSVLLGKQNDALAKKVMGDTEQNGAKALGIAGNTVGKINDLNISSSKTQQTYLKDANKLRDNALTQQLQLAYEAYGKEALTENNHYQDELNKLTDFLKKKEITQKQFDEVKAQLDNEHHANLGAIIDKYNEQDKERVRQAQNELAELQINGMRDGAEKQTAELQQQQTEKNQQLDKIDAESLNRVARLNNEIRAATDKDPKADTSELQKRLDAEYQLMALNCKKEEALEQQTADAIKKIKDQERQDKLLRSDQDTIGSTKDPEAKLTAEKKLITDKYQFEIEQAHGNAEQIKEIQKKLDDEILALTEKATAEKNEKEKKAAEELAKFEEEQEKKVAEAAFKLINERIKQASEAKIASLEQDKSAELSNSALTSAQKLAIEQKYKQQEAQVKIKAFKQEQEASIAQAVINGALAITKGTSQTGVLAALFIPAIIAETAIQVATIAAQKPPAYEEGGLHYASDGRGGLLPGYSRRDNTNAYLRSGEGIVVSEAMQAPWARNLVSAINVGFGGRDFSTASTGRGFAVGGIFTDGGDANRYYNQPVHDQKNLANSIAYQMINNFPPVYVDVKDINNQQNILAQTINRVNL